ncbi:MAG: YdcF family protein [Firmicutes bacterium]|nr:YdcF family protein [Bacillota bacterium]
MKIKALCAFLGILSAVCVLYGAAVISIIGPGSWFNWAFVAIGVFAGAGAALLSRIGRLPAGVRTGLAAVLCACILIFAVTEARIMSFAASDEAPGADWVVILGAKVDPWGPSLEYSARIRRAAEYLKNSPQSIAVTTGGQGVNEPVSEGRAAADMLQDLGIQADRIIAEDRSTSTAENLAFARILIEEAGGDVAADRVVIVSSSFHLYRADLHARDCGYGNRGSLGSEGLRILMPQYYLREFAALVKEYVL